MEADAEQAIWNEVSTDFDPDEETANFGTRQALESDGNLYEVRESEKGCSSAKYLNSRLSRLPQ